MVSQARSVATRQRIIDVAVDLFAESGYSAVGLNTLVAAAKVTTGAFYYHFDSKEALAMAIIGQGWPKLLDVVDQHANSSERGMESVIELAFAISDLMKRDKTVGMGQHFNLAFTQLSQEFLRESRGRAAAFISSLGDLLRETELRDDVTPEAVGTQLWMDVNGCHLLSDRMGDSVVPRIADSLRLLVRATVPPDSLCRVEKFITQTAAKYE